MSKRGSPTPSEPAKAKKMSKVGPSTTSEAVKTKESDGEDPVKVGVTYFKLCHFCRRDIRNPCQLCERTASRDDCPFEVCPDCNRAFHLHCKNEKERTREQSKPFPTLNPQRCPVCQILAEKTK